MDGQMDKQYMKKKRWMVGWMDRKKTHEKIDGQKNR